MTTHPCFSDFACFPNVDDIYGKHIPRARAFEKGCSIHCSARALFGIDVRRNEWSIPFSHWPDFRFCGVEACVRDGVVPENFLFRFAMIALFFFSRRKLKCPGSALGSIVNKINTDVEKCVLCSGSCFSGYRPGEQGPKQS